jgi:Flp pilus assembly protein TadG
MFLMLVFGTIEFGRILWTEQALQETATAGVRCMAIAQGLKGAVLSPCASGGSYSDAATKSYIQSVAGGWGLSLPNSGITPDNTAACGSGGTDFSQVTVTTTFTSVVPNLLQLATGGTTLTATACYPNNT